MTTWDLIIALFYHVDEQLHALPKHPCQMDTIFLLSVLTLYWGRVVL